MFSKIPARWFLFLSGVVAVCEVCAQAQVNPSIAPPHAVQSPERCIPAAAQHHRIDPRLLRAVLKVESDLRPWAFGRNANGTVDMGMAQINSIHLPELARHGIQSQHLFDPCVASYVAAWLLRKNIDRHGLTWHGVAWGGSLPLAHARAQPAVSGLADEGFVPRCGCQQASGSGRERHIDHRPCQHNHQRKCHIKRQHD